MNALTRKVASGAAILSAVQVIRVVTQFVIVLPIMTRLLTPEEYGIVGMAMTLVLFFMVFNDFGIGSALVREEKPTPALWSSALWTNLGIGVVLASIAFFSADAIGAFFRDPRASPVVEVLAIVLVIHCLSITPTAWLQRHMRFNQLALTQLGSQILGSTVAIVAAFNGAGLWALVIEQIVQHLSRAATVLVLARAPVRLGYDWPSIRRILPFSANIMGADFTGYVARNADKLLIGRYLDATALGLYGRAYQVMLAPVQVILRGAGTTLFPALSTLQADRRRAGEAYLKGVKLIAIVAFPMMLGISAVSGPLVRFGFGESWANTAPILAILAPVGALQAVTATRGTLFKAIGRADLLFYWALFANSMAVLSFVIGLNWGVRGVATAYLIASLIMFTPAMAFLLWQVKQSVRDLLMRIAPAALSSCLMAFASWQASVWLAARGVSDPGQLVLCVPLGMAVYGVLMLVLDRPGTLDLLRLGRGLIGVGR